MIRRGHSLFKTGAEGSILNFKRPWIEEVPHGVGGGGGGTSYLWRKPFLRKGPVDTEFLLLKRRRELVTFDSLCLLSGPCTFMSKRAQGRPSREGRTVRLGGGDLFFKGEIRP